MTLPMSLVMSVIVCTLLVVVETTFALVGSSSSSSSSGHHWTAKSMTDTVIEQSRKTVSMTTDSIMNDTRTGYNNQQYMHDPLLALAAIPSLSSPVMSMPSHSPPLRQVHPISSMKELLAIMNGKLHVDRSDTTNYDNQLTVIKYYADYCKLCQRASIQMKRLVNEFPTTVKFAKVEQATLTEPTIDTLHALGVTKFPFIQIYRHGQCVASFSTGPSHMFRKRVLDTVRLCLERSPDNWQDFYNEFATPIQENANTRQRLLADIMQQQQQQAPNMGP
jgi:hypothetical protein